jgi:hypothetical protein
MSKIGIGIITMGVRKIHANIPFLCDPSALVRVETDFLKEGPGRTRNKCLKFLMDQGCEHIFMFDDDCYPIHKGWEKYFIDVAKTHGIHFMGLPNAFESRLKLLTGELGYWSEILGCFSYQDRRLMETVGYYNTAYVRYGSEDNGRNHRAFKSGLCGVGAGSPAPLRATSYIFSEDVYHLNPVANMTPEEKRHFIDLNHQTFLKEINGRQIFYPAE